MKITKEMKELIWEWLGYDDQPPIDNSSYILGSYLEGPRVKGLHCPVLGRDLGNKTMKHRNKYCIACRSAFGLTGSGPMCSCKMIGVKKTEEKAREILELEEV